MILWGITGTFALRFMMFWHPGIWLMMCFTLRSLNYQTEILSEVWDELYREEPLILETFLWSPDYKLGVMPGVIRNQSPACLLVSWLLIIIILFNFLFLNIPLGHLDVRQSIDWNMGGFFSSSWISRVVCYVWTLFSIKKIQHKYGVMYPHIEGRLAPGPDMGLRKDRRLQVNLQQQFHLGWVRWEGREIVW